MSMADYEHARKLAQQAGADFLGERPEEVITAAESRLGLSFPPTYRRFLRELGCGGVGSEDFYGVIRNSFENGSAPNGIWLTIDQRKSANLAPTMIIVQSAGDGSWYAIDAAKRNEDGESPIVLLDVNCRPQEVVAEDFGRFFLDRVVFALGPPAHC